jgi:hypothetical protein
MRQRHLDTLLLEQAYQATHLKQHIPNLTIGQVQVVLENASPSELEVIEEFVGGMKNLAQGVGGTLRKAGAAVKDTVTSAGKAVKAGAQQAGKNLKDMYQTGEVDAAAAKRVQQLEVQLGELEKLLAAHIKVSKNSNLKNKPIEDMTLGSIKQALGDSAADKSNKAAAAQQKGVFGGVKKAMTDGAAAAAAGQKAPAGGLPKQSSTAVPAAFATAAQQAARA